MIPYVPFFFFFTLKNDCESLYNVLLEAHFIFCATLQGGVHAFLYKQHFYKQHQAKTGNKPSKS